DRCGPGRLLRRPRRVPRRARSGQSRHPDRDVEPRPARCVGADPGPGAARSDLTPVGAGPPGRPRPPPRYPGTRPVMPDDKPRTLKAMLSEAKDPSELMVDLAYAALFYGDAGMADEVHELDERLSDLAHSMREVCVLAARSPHDAEQMSSVL